jgi:hypothetical protein
MNAAANVPKEKYIKTAAGAGILTAIVEIPQMIRNLFAIEKDETLTKKEKSAAKGGEIGDTTGSILGAGGGAALTVAATTAVGALASGALTGTAIGTAVPGLGNAIGALVGAGLGLATYYICKNTGRKLGTMIGGAVAGDDKMAAQSTETAYTGSAMAYPGIAPWETYDENYIATRYNRLRPQQVNDFDETAAQSPEAVFTTSAMAYPGIAPWETYDENYIATRHNRPRPQQVNDLIVTPQGQFSTHPDDFIFAMKNPSSLVNNEIKKEIHTVESVPQAKTPVIVEGEIELKSELVIDDKGYKLRQRVGKNTTPYKFAVGSASDARLI